MRESGYYWVLTSEEADENDWEPAFLDEQGSWWLIDNRHSIKESGNIVEVGERLIHA